ncbi:MAG: hypothetical protein JWR50_595 [Mucilaginibacter sp.]|nr:hypothetical protein [Mucilaginibacter sp.]
MPATFNTRLMKSPTSTPATNIGTKKTSVKSSEEIKTDFPMSEKDEVKKAEQKLQQAQKKSN